MWCQPIKAEQKAQNEKRQKKTKQEDKIRDKIRQIRKNKRIKQTDVLKTDNAFFFELGVFRDHLTITTSINLICLLFHEKFVLLLATQNNETFDHTLE